MAAETKQELEKAYGGVLTKKRDHTVDVRTTINLGAPDVKEHFNRAKGGVDSFDEKLAQELNGGIRTRVYRSDPLDTKELYNKPAFTALERIIDKKLAGGPWGEKEIAEYDRAIAAVSQRTGLDNDHVWTMTKDYENLCRQDNAQYAKEFMSPPASRLKAEIGEALVKRATGGQLTPEEQKKLDQNLDRLSKETKMSPENLKNEVGVFEQKVQHGADKRREKLATRYAADAEDAKNGGGKFFEYDALQVEDHIVVPKASSKSPEANFALWGLAPGDYPKKPPPGSPEMAAFLFGLHESEHANRSGTVVGRDGLSEGSQWQAKEIDADAAILKFLNDANEPAAKEYWLQNREVRSFTDGLTANDLDHDTATFLRVYEKTGKQIDLDAFDKEKRGLFDRVKDKLQVMKDHQVKVGDAMGAVEDLLKDDDDPKNTSKKLTPVQRAEAESFLQDAAAMGFEANHDYPQAVHDTAPLPPIPPPPLPPDEPSVKPIKPQ